jgi:UDP-glucose 4-epimerase
MRILITGGSGYIGTYLARWLEGKHDVVLFDQVESEAGFACMQGDLCEYSAVREACSGVCAIIHAGAIPYDSGEAHKILEVNVMGTFNVLEAAIENGVERVIFTSSMCATGIGPFSRQAVLPEYFPVNESQSCQPEDTYGLSKLLGEELCEAYSRKHGLVTICLRLGMVYDPNRPDSVNRLGRIMEDPDYGSLYHWGCLDVRDMAQAFQLSLGVDASSQGVFNLCGPEVAAMEPTLELVGRYFTNAPLREPQLYFENPYRGLIDIERARRRLGFLPQYPVRRSWSGVQR